MVVGRFRENHAFRVIGKNFPRALFLSFVLLFACFAVTFNYYVSPAYAMAEYIDMSSIFCIYGDVVSLCSSNYTLRYFDVTTQLLTDTYHSLSVGFHSLYENSVAQLVYGSDGDIEYYDISTGNTETKHMNGFPDSISIWDVINWAVNWPARPISTYGNITAFTEFPTGTCYINRSTGNWLKISGGTKGVSVYKDIIAFSDGIVRYYDLISGTAFSTGQAGSAPSIYGDIIAFTNGSSILYYNITSGLTKFIALGNYPSIYDNTIVFSTSETAVNTDLNGDGDLNDSVIRYYDIQRGIIVNTKEVGFGPSVYGNTIAYYARENWLGKDMNGDGVISDSYALMYMLIQPHNIAITKITSSTNMTSGEDVAIYVTVENRGNYTETFNVEVFLSIYANTTFLGNQTVNALAPTAKKTLTFSWNPKGFLVGPYKITAIAKRVPYEINTRDNDDTYGVIRVQNMNNHTLSIFSYPAWSVLSPFFINNTRNVSPWIGALSEGTYIITMPKTVADNGTIYEFQKWEDNTTDPIRTINLMANKNIIAYYENSSTMLPIIYASPIVTTVRPDDNFEINITIANATNLFTWDVKIYYDSRFMNAKDATERAFLKSAGTTTFRIRELNDAYNATHGRVWLNCTLQGLSSGANGSDTLATIVFNATASGNSIITLGETQLYDKFSNTINSTPLQGVGLIRVKLTSDVNNDGVVDIFDIVTIGVSYGTKRGEKPDPPRHLGFNPHADIVKGAISKDIIDIFDLVMVGVHFGEIDP